SLGLDIERFAFVHERDNARSPCDYSKSIRRLRAVRARRALPGTLQECGTARSLASLPAQPRHPRCRAVAMRLRRIRKPSSLRRMPRDISHPTDALWELPSLARSP